MGLGPTGAMGFGIVSEKSRRRRPLPPQKITTFICAPFSQVRNVTKPKKGFSIIFICRMPALQLEFHYSLNSLPDQKCATTSDDRGKLQCATRVNWHHPIGD